MGEKGAIVDAFVDRIEELAALEEQFADHQAAMAVIYGRRRIGKTALITEFWRRRSRRNRTARPSRNRWPRSRATSCSARCP